MPYVALMVFKVGLWVGIGVLAGCLLAIFTFLAEPRGPDRGQVALVVLFVVVVLGTLIGLGISIAGLWRFFFERHTGRSITLDSK